MNISRINLNKNKTASFKRLYVEDNVKVGDVQTYRRGHFIKRDVLLLHEIESKYPNQDCFIRKGKDKLPILEFRETPVIIPDFHECLGKIYRSELEMEDKKNPCINFILLPNSDLNKFIGVTSDFSLNPSLINTVRAGYDLHKRFLEKKYQILDEIGPGEEPNIGAKNILEKSKELIAEEETAVMRNLLEAAGSATLNYEQAAEIFPTISAKIENGLMQKRKFDMTKPLYQHPKIDMGNFTSGSRDYCELSMEAFPNLQENKSKLQTVIDLLYKFKMYTGPLVQSS